MVVGLREGRGANALKVQLHLKLKDGGRSTGRMRSECAQGPLAFGVETWWSVYVKDEERMRSRSTCI
jgi:hypothetical protein